MKKYFAVSFKYSESVYCSNIAHAETAEAVNAHYSKYEWVSVRECKDYEVEAARRKGMPIVEIETPEAVTEEPEQKEEETEMENTRTAEKITNEIIAYFREHEDTYNSAAEELDAYNGYLGDDRYYSMDELNEFYSGTEPTEILLRAFYGYDEETWHTDASGNREYGPFNPNREYFRYNGYGNLVSADYKDYTGLLDHYIIESMLENRHYIDTIDNDTELSDLFDELENAKSKSEEA